MFTRSASILLIDASPACVSEIVAPLNGRGHRVTHVLTAREGLENIYRSRPDMLLLDRSLPDMDGLHFCSELKNDAVFRQIPIILLDPGDLPDTEIVAGEAGADDCVKKPVDLEELEGRIREIFRLGTLGVSSHPLTGLPGYNTIYRIFQRVLEQEARFAVCFMDIQGFRRFNQVHGYEKGDEILAATARLVSRALDSRRRLLDFFGHLGSDDFVLITDPEGVEDLCTDIVERFEWAFPDLATPVEMELGDPISASHRSGLPRERIYLSIAIVTCEGRNRPIHAAALIDQGRKLLAQARRKGRSRWVREECQVSQDSHEGQAPGPAALGRGSRKLLDGSFLGRSEAQVADLFGFFRELMHSRALQLHFQPIIYLDSRELYGYEALLRGPEGSYLQSPVILFSLARKLDMEQDLDLICVEKLLESMDNIEPGVKIFFNVSPDSFFSPRFRESCEKAATARTIPRTVFEITGKERILEFPRFRESLDHFRNLGFQVAVDDVKAGTLSLRTVLELVPDYIKADVTLVRDIHRDPSKQKVFQRFRTICSQQKGTLIPEGVESELERDYLLRNGAKLGQGFLFSHPQPLT